MNHRRTRSRILAVAIGLAVGLAAIGAGPASAVTLDSKKTAKAVVALAKKDYGAEVSGLVVTDPICPSKVKQQADLDFACTVRLNGNTLTYAIHQKDGKGNVRIDPVEAVIFVDKAVAAIRSELEKNNAGKKITVDCGPGTILIVAPAKSFDCKVKVATKASVVRVIVKDNTGNVDFKAI